MLHREHVSRSNSPHFAVKFGNINFEDFYNGSLRNSLCDIFPMKRCECFVSSQYYDSDPDFVTESLRVNPIFAFGQYFMHCPQRMHSAVSICKVFSGLMLIARVGQT